MSMIIIMISACFASSVQATPVTATIELASNYSLIHPWGNGNGSSSEWLWFDEGQTIDLDYNGGILILDGAQSFTLSDSNNATATIDILALIFDLNDGSDGFLGGMMAYMLDGTFGAFVFNNSNYGSSVFNSSTWDWRTNMLNVYGWGGDAFNGLGIDFSISAKIPEPSGLALMVAGLLGFGVARRKLK